jgi:hypothetical protein
VQLLRKSVFSARPGTLNHVYDHVTSVSSLAKPNRPRQAGR